MTPASSAGAKESRWRRLLLAEVTADRAQVVVAREEILERHHGVACVDILRFNFSDERIAIGHVPGDYIK